MTRIHQGGTSYIYRITYEESSGNFWLFMRNWFALTFRHTIFEKFLSYLGICVEKLSLLLNYKLYGWTVTSLEWSHPLNCHIYWIVTSTELTLLLNFCFYWIFASTELSLLMNCHTYWIVIPTLNSSSACSLTTNMQVLKAHSKRIQPF